MTKRKRQIRSRRRIQLSLVVAFGLFAIFGLVLVNKAAAQAQQAQTQEISAARAEVSKFGLIASAIAFGFGAIGAGVAIASVGAAGIGAVAEKPDIAGQALIFIALAEGLVVFGFITALMILGKVV